MPPSTQHCLIDQRPSSPPSHPSPSPHRQTMPRVHNTQAQHAVHALGVIPGRGQHPSPVSLDSAQPLTHRAYSFVLHVPRISPSHSVFRKSRLFQWIQSAQVCFRDELEKSYEIVIPPTRPANASSRHTQQAPSHLQVPTSGNPNGNGHGSGSGGGALNKVPPTAPRAHKKPRLSEARASPCHLEQCPPACTNADEWSLRISSHGVT
jgi:hypothetical protein